MKMELDKLAARYYEYDDQAVTFWYKKFAGSAEKQGRAPVGYRAFISEMLREGERPATDEWDTKHKEWFNRRHIDLGIDSLSNGWWTEAMGRASTDYRYFLDKMINKDGVKPGTEEWNRRQKEWFEERVKGGAGPVDRNWESEAAKRSYSREYLSGRPPGRLELPSPFLEGDNIPPSLGFGRKNPKKKGKWR